jgi:hypothetical protein
MSSFLFFISDSFSNRFNRISSYFLFYLLLLAFSNINYYKKLSSLTTIDLSVIVSWVYPNLDTYDVFKNNAPTLLPFIPLLLPNFNGSNDFDLESYKLSFCFLCTIEYN